MKTKIKEQVCEVCEHKDCIARVCYACLEVREQETLAKVGEEIDKNMKEYKNCDTLRERAMWDALFKLKQKLRIK